VSSADPLRRLLIVQRRRLVATFLGYAEANVYPLLSQEQADKFRTEFLDAVGAYHELMLDIVQANDDETVIINAEAMALLRDIRADLRRREG